MTHNPFAQRELIAWGQLRFAAILLVFSPPTLSAPPSAPLMDFVSASIVYGSGQPLPPGGAPVSRDLSGMIRVRGLKVRKSDFVIMAQLGGGGPAETTRVPLVLKTFNANDPVDPTLFHWSARWPKDGPPEGWNLTVVYRRNHTRVSVTGPIKVHLLPPSRPSTDDQPK